MGHNNTVQTIATFTGTLLRRERAVGQKHIQLVFRENNENWLCVSADMKHNALVVGKKYRVEGVFRKYGERPYIHTPNITLHKSRFRKLAPYGVGVFVLASVLSMVMYSYSGNHSNASHVLGTSVAPNPAAYVTQTAGNAVAPTMAQVQAESPTTSASSTDVTKKTTTKPAQTNTTQQTTTSAQQTPTTATPTENSAQTTDGTGSVNDNTSGNGGDAASDGGSAGTDSGSHDTDQTGATGTVSPQVVPTPVQSEGDE